MCTHQGQIAEQGSGNASWRSVWGAEPCRRLRHDLLWLHLSWAVPAPHSRAARQAGEQERWKKAIEERAVGDRGWGVGSQAIQWA